LWRGSVNDVRDGDCLIGVPLGLDLRAGRLGIGVGLLGRGVGLLRDVVVRDVPALMRPGQFSSLTLAGACSLFEILIYYKVNPTRAAWSVVAAFFIIRVLTVRFNWQSRPVLRELANEEPKPRFFRMK